jgi:hypothetical protein
MSETRKLYTIRPSYLYKAKHMNDKFLNLGYDYRGKILKNGTSPELWANPLQNPGYSTLESMITFILEQAKYIKKWFSIAHDKNTTNIS